MQEYDNRLALGGKNDCTQMEFNSNFAKRSTLPHWSRDISTTDINCNLALI